MFGVALSATPTFLFTSLRAILHFATIISHKGAEMHPQHHYHTKLVARRADGTISHKAGGTQSRLTPVLFVD